jgi:hypothetical protein
MSLRTRVIVFIAVLLGCSVAPLSTPWPLVIACVVYLVVVLPAIGRKS